MSRLFRQAALDKITRPDQLDQVVNVVRPLHGLGVAVVLIVIVAGLTWGVFSTAPVSVRGQGILLSAQGVAIVTAPGQGRVEHIVAQAGAKVRAGETVALLSQSATLDALTAKQAQLEGARGVLDARRAEYKLYRRMQDELLETKRLALSEQLENLLEQQNVMLDRHRSLQTLMAKGFTTSSRLNEAQVQLAELQNRIAELRNERVELTLKQATDDDQRRREIREAELNVRALEHELLNMERDYERRRTLFSPVDGTVVELDVNQGDLVTTGQIIMRLLPAGAPDAGMLRAIVFVPNEDGKKVKPGMEAHIMPSTSRLQKDGFIRGEVLSVARIPSSREGMMRRLNNAALVDTLLRTGAPFEVELGLQADSATPSGYRWSSGRGPDISIDVGTMTTADMVVERRRVISLALPVFDYVLRWMGMQ